MWSLTTHRNYGIQNSATRTATTFFAHGVLRRVFSFAVFGSCVLSVLLELVEGSGPNFEDLYASAACRRWAINHAKSTSSSFFSNMMRARNAQSARDCKAAQLCFLILSTRTIDATRGTPSVAVYTPSYVHYCSAALPPLTSVTASKISSMRSDGLDAGPERAGPVRAQSSQCQRLSAYIHSLSVESVFYFIRESIVTWSVVTS